MLLGTRYADDDILGMDGVTYHFSMDLGRETMAGKTWSPDPESKPGKLVKISDLMVDFAKTRKGPRKGCFLA